MNCTGCVFEIRNIATPSDIQNRWEVSSYVVGVDGSRLQHSKNDTVYDRRQAAEQYLIDQSNACLLPSTTQEISMVLKTVPAGLEFDLLISWDACSSHQALNSYTLNNVSASVRFRPVETKPSGSSLLDLAADICSF